MVQRKSLLTEEVKSFFLSLVDVLDVGRGLQKKGRDQGFIPYLPVREFCDEISEIVMPDLPMLRETSVTDLMAVLNSQSLQPIKPSGLDGIIDDTLLFLQHHLLPVFLPSQHFIDFLLDADKECLFNGISKDTAGLDRTADAQGHKRSCLDADEYIDTGYLHGGQQRMRVTVAYPQLKRR